MKTLNIWDYKSVVGKITMGLVLAAMIGSMDVTSALGRGHGHGNDDHDAPGGHGYEQHIPPGHAYGHIPPGHAYGRYKNMRPYYDGYYRGRGYGPPPVVYAPPPRPGISIFFPPIVIHP